MSKITKGLEYSLRHSLTKIAVVGVNYSSQFLVNLYITVVVIKETTGYEKWCEKYFEQIDGQISPKFSFWK